MWETLIIQTIQNNNLVLSLSTAKASMPKFSIITLEDEWASGLRDSVPSARVSRNQPSDALAAPEQRSRRLVSSHVTRWTSKITNNHCTLYNGFFHLRWEKVCRKSVVGQKNASLCMSDLLIFPVFFGRSLLHTSAQGWYARSSWRVRSALLD